MTTAVLAPSLQSSVGHSGLPARLIPEYGPVPGSGGVAVQRLAGGAAQQERAVADGARQQPGRYSVPLGGQFRLSA
jgi:hypothetical protein